MTVLVSDSFTRADSTTVLGNADTGQTWQKFGQAIGILSNQAYISVASDGFAYIDATASDVTVFATHSTYQAWSKVVWRLADSNNYYWTEANKIYKKSSGATTTIATLTGSPSNGAIVKVVVSGNTHTVYINGTQVGTFTDTFNQTATKHGFGLGHSTARIDNFSVESGSGTPAGTDGSTAFDLRQSLFADSAVNADSRQSFYSDSVMAFDSVQAIYSDSASAYDTRLNLYQDKATLFDTLQEFFSDGIVGSTPFDLRFVLYADNSAVFDSRQAFYIDGVSAADLAQQFYQVSGIISDMKPILYADALAQFDSKQSLYSDAFIKADTTQRYYTDGNIDYDTLQAILDDWAQYNEVIRFVLNISRKQTSDISITRKQTATLGFTQRKQSELNL